MPAGAQALSAWPASRMLVLLRACCRARAALSRQHDAKAKVSGPTLRRRGFAIGTAAGPAITVPRATPKAAQRPLGRARWVRLRTDLVISLVIPILTPFPDIAVHVVQAES